MIRQKPMLQEVDIRYETVCACEKEAIKEFFRFIGCLVYEEPIDAAQSMEDIPRTQMNQKAQIILRAAEQPSTALESFALKGTDALEENFVFVFCNLANKAFAVWPGGKQPGNVNYARDLVDAVIDVIWSEEPIQCAEVKQIHNVYCQENLLTYLQCKRAFRVLRMNEILDMDGEVGEIPASEFIRDMVAAFQTAAWNLREMDTNSQSVYPVYAWVNAERKVRELALQLSSGMVVEDVASARSLLAELDELDETDETGGKMISSYTGRYFLAAFICLTDEELKLQANHYYILALQSANPKLVERIFSDRPLMEEELAQKSYLVAFIFYQIGMYNEKVLKKEEAANRYYQCAIKCNENCYQALFKRACDAAKRNLFAEAILLFEKVSKILSKGLDLDQQENWKYLSMKEWQYLYKTSIWRAKIEWKCRGEAYTWQYLQKAEQAADAYRKNGCLMELIPSHKLSEYSEYHVNSAPVQKLDALLEQWKKSSRMYES